MASKKKSPTKSTSKKNAPNAKSANLRKISVTGEGFLAHLHDEIGKLLGRNTVDQEAGFPWPWLSPDKRKALGFPYSGPTPNVDMGESDTEYEVHAELPGLDEKDINVSVTDHSLTIRGEKHDKRDVKNKDYHLSERSYGSFRRSLSIPGGVDTNKISASFKHGVLSVRLPKSNSAKAKHRKVAVNATD